jgi:hypothetical protein
VPSSRIRTRSASECVRNTKRPRVCSEHEASASAFGTRSASECRSALRVRRVLSLANIRASRLQLLCRPQVSCATALRPYGSSGHYERRGPQRARTVGLELRQHRLGSDARVPNDYMHVVGANGTFAEFPVADAAVVRDDVSDEFPSPVAESYGWMRHPGPGLLGTIVAGFQKGGSVCSVLPVDGTARIAVQPRAICSPRQKIGTRVGHRGGLYPEARSGALVSASCSEALAGASCSDKEA